MLSGPDTIPKALALNWMTYGFEGNPARTEGYGRKKETKLPHPRPKIWSLKGAHIEVASVRQAGVTAERERT